MAIEIKGNWKKGFALALHTISSTYLGKNEFGYDHYDTIRTKIGELVYKLKYQNDSTAVQKLVNEIKKCISGIERFDLIIPVPPSNKNRPKQPVILVCEAISKEFNVPFLPNALVKSSAARELKDITDTDERKKELQNVIKITAVDRIEGGKDIINR